MLSNNSISWVLLDLLYLTSNVHLHRGSGQPLKVVLKWYSYGIGCEMIKQIDDRVYTYLSENELYLVRFLI